MARVAAVLGHGELATAVAAIVGPVPPNEIWYVTRLDFVNTASEDVMVEVYINTAGVPRKWDQGMLKASGGRGESITDGKAVILGTGNMILARASAASAVQFYAAGVKDT